MKIATQHVYAVIMAGGSGERFWPLGRQNRPKQLVALNGKTTMIEETVQRLFPLILPENVLVITNQSYVKSIQQLLPIPPGNVIGEPARCNTAPCVALAAALIARRDPQGTMILLPADHLIRPAKKFQEVLSAAVDVAQNHFLVTLGVVPTYPATGYGYIHAGNNITPNFRQVEEFKEKPDHDTAVKFLSSGQYLWNSGMFIWQLDTIITAFQKYAPQLHAKLQNWIQGADFTADFATCEKISIDYAVMEKADNVVVGNADFEWNDIGCWSSLRSVFPLDAAGNATTGNVLTIDATDNVLVNDSNTMLGVIGLDNIAVIHAGNGILVCALEQEQQVKELVQKLHKTQPDFV